MKYEVKKLFSSKGILFAFIVMIVSYAFFVFVSAKNKTEVNPALEKVIDYYSDFDGSKLELLDVMQKRTDLLTMTMALQGDSIFEEEGSFGDNLYQDIIAHSIANDIAIKKYRTFPYNRKKVIFDSLYRINDELKKEHPSEKVIKTNRLVVKKYNPIIDIPFKEVGKIDGFLNSFDFTAFDYIMILFIIMISVKLLLYDVELGSYQIVYSSLNGRKKLFVRKYILLLGILTIITLTQFAIQLFIANRIYGVNDFLVPIQSFDIFEMCPYQITIMDYLLIRVLCKWLFYAMLSALSAFFAILTRKSIGSLIGLGFITLSLQLFVEKMFFYSRSNEVDVLSNKYKMFEIIRCIIPNNLLNIRSYFDHFDYVYMVGVNVYRLFIAVFISLLITIVSLVISYNKYGKERVSL